MKKYNDNINKLKTYLYGEQPVKKNIIKLNTNENPYPPTIKIVKNIINEIKFFGNILRFYPDSESIKIKKIISKYYNIKINQIFIGNGSDETLAHSFITFLKSEKYLYIPSITYSFYESYIKLYKIKYRLMELNKNFSIKKFLYKKYKYNLIITNPNAPTGKLISCRDIEIITMNNPESIVIVDEAYIDFGGVSSINLIKKYKNILIIQTASKSRSIAGLRLGLAIGDKILIEKLEKVKNSFNSYPVNILTQNISICSYKENLYFKKLKEKLIKNRDYLIKELKNFKFKIINSKSNFILVSHKKININLIVNNLKNKNIFIRKFEIPRIENYARITIESKKNLKKLIYYIKKIILNII